MAFETHIHKKVSTEYTQRRLLRESILQDRRAEVYERIPQIAQIDNELSNTGFMMFAKVMDGQSADDAVRTIMEADSRLKERKEKLLIEAGIPKDYLEVAFGCSKCKDTGFVENKMCECYKKALVAEAFKESNLEKLQKVTFKDFDIEYYQDQASDGKISPRENMQSVLEQCKIFIEDFDTDEYNLLMYGKPGTGKTFLSSCIANELIKHGHSVLYQTAGAVFSLLESIRFNRNVDEVKLFAAERIFDCEVLIIDDLGTEFITEFSRGELFRILNTRLLSKKKMIFSTNLTMSEISRNYSERIASRIVGGFKLLHFFGEDIRLIKRYKERG